MRRPDLRYINSSYASNLSIRDNVKSRTLIQSGWYQAQWGSVFRLRDDQNVKVKFENYHSEGPFADQTSRSRTNGAQAGFMRVNRLFWLPFV